LTQAAVSGTRPPLLLSVGLFRKPSALDHESRERIICTGYRNFIYAIKPDN